MRCHHDPHCGSGPSHRPSRVCVSASPRLLLTHRPSEGSPLSAETSWLPARGGPIPQADGLFQGTGGWPAVLRHTGLLCGFRVQTPWKRLVSTTTDKRQTSTMNNPRRPHGTGRSVNTPHGNKTEGRMSWQRALFPRPAPPWDYLIRKKSHCPSRLASPIRSSCLQGFHPAPPPTCSGSCSSNSMTSEADLPRLTAPTSRA